MSELDDLERELLGAADTWFSQALHLKLQRLITIAREGERAKDVLGSRIVRENPLIEIRMEGSGGSCEVRE